METTEIGLIYNTEQMGNEPSWFLDNYSTEIYGSSWENFGFEIIFRIEEIKASIRLIGQIKKGFKAVFKLPEDRYSFEPTFWRVYWDNGQLRLNFIKECEQHVDEIARRNKIAIKLNGIIIQPRPMGYIQEFIKNSKLSKQRTSQA